MSFTEEEITYLRTQRLARIATVFPSSDRAPTCELRPPFRGPGTWMGARSHTTRRSSTGAPSTNLRSSRARRRGVHNDR